jgi:hypothetical protein
MSIRISSAAFFLCVGILLPSAAYAWQDLYYVPLGWTLDAIQKVREVPIDTMRKGPPNAPDIWHRDFKWTSLQSEDTLHGMYGTSTWFFEDGKLIAMMWTTSSPTKTYEQLQRELDNYLGEGFESEVPKSKRTLFRLMDIDYRLFKFATGEITMAVTSCEVANRKR